MNPKELQILTLPDCSDNLLAEAIAVESGLENYFLLFSRSPREIWVFVQEHPKWNLCFTPLSTLRGS
jgi:hypothetical protein